MHRTEIVKKLIEETGMNQKTFAASAGIPYTTLRSVLQRGLGNSSVENVIKICKALGITIEQLEEMANAGNINMINEGAAKYVTEMNDVLNLPLYGQVSCGNGLVSFDPPLKTIPTPKNWINGGSYFYLTATGDSMTGKNIEEGDQLLIRAQEEVENKEIAVVVIDDKIFLKTFIKDGETVILQSENSKYPPMIYKPETNQCIRIIGKLKMAIKKF